MFKREFKDKDCGKKQVEFLGIPQHLLWERQGDGSTVEDEKP